jgi:hypothetical protein
MRAKGPKTRVKSPPTVVFKRRKVPVKLSLDPELVGSVRATLRDGLSLSVHVTRLLRADLDRLAGGGKGQPASTASRAQDDKDSF